MPILLLCLLLGALPIQRPPDIVKWSAEGPAKPVAPGGIATIELTAQIEPGWKLYAVTQPKGGPVPLAINVAKGAPFQIVRKDIEPPVPRIQKDEQFSLETQYYERSARFVLPVALPKTASGAQVIPLEVTFQACGENLCLRPYTQRLTVTVALAK